MTEQAATSGKLVRFLNDTEPAKLLLWCGAAITIAALCGITRFYLQTELSWTDAQQVYETGSTQSTFVTPYTTQNDTTGLVRIRGLFAFLMGVGAFIFGVIGGLLPMWAVGRLIADAIREGHTNE